MGAVICSGEAEMTSRVRSAVGCFAKRFVRTRGRLRFRVTGAGATEESDVSSTVCSRGGMLLPFFLIKRGDANAETLDSLKTSEPCGLSGFLTRTLACCDSAKLVTGVRGGGDEGSVDGESGACVSFLDLPFEDVGDVSDGILGLISPNSDCEDKEGSLDQLRAIRKAGAMGDTD
jgi:hypothetical protein